MDTLSDPRARIVQYIPAGPVTQQFLDSNDFVRGIMGPIGSGKSSACVLEILKRAQQQTPSPDGIRRTRWVIVRNSFPELKTTTIKTWADWCPLAYGKITYDSPIVHHVRTAGLDMEVLFMALDREEDVKKLLSLEVTGAWVNEAREIPKGIIDALTGRVGRYPKKDLGGATWSGIIMDTNPPDDQGWWFASDNDTPEGWKFFRQPAGDGSDIDPITGNPIPGENIPNLPYGYYKRITANKDPDWIKVYVQGKYGYVSEGKPVFPMYRDHFHTSKTPIVANPAFPLELGADFGLTPACIIGQRYPDGRWVIIDELITDDCGVKRFAELLRKYLASKYPEMQVGAAWGDPAGNTRGQEEEKTALEIMRAHTEFPWKAAPSNDLLMRREVVIGALNRVVDANPGMLVSPKCKILRKAMTGGYHYRSFRTGNGTQWHEVPHKNQFSHPADALQYLLLGGGEHSVILNKETRNRRRQSSDGNRDNGRVARDLDYSVFGDQDLD